MNGLRAAQLQMFFCRQLVGKVLYISGWISEAVREPRATEYKTVDQKAKPLKHGDVRAYIIYIKYQALYLVILRND